MVRKGKEAESSKKRRMLESPEQTTPPGRSKGRGKSSDPPGPSGVNGKKKEIMYAELLQRRKDAAAVASSGDSEALKEMAEQQIHIND